MGFRNYCIVAMGNLKGVDRVIKSMAESDPNFLQPEGGILISTFSSMVEVAALTDFFKLYIENFLVYELSPNTSGQSFKDSKIQDGLFGLLEKMNEAALREKSEEFLRVVTGSTNPNFSTPASSSAVAEKSIRKRPSPEVDIDSLTFDEKNEMMNEIIKKGANSLTKADKEMLVKLTK